MLWLLTKSINNVHDYFLEKAASSDAAFILSALKKCIEAVFTYKNAKNDH